MYPAATCKKSNTITISCSASRSVRWRTVRRGAARQDAREFCSVAGSQRVATDFFQRQEHARRNTLWLRLGFALAVLTVIAAATFVTLLCFGKMGGATTETVLQRMVAHPKVALFFASVFAALILIPSAWRTWKLRREGGGAIARALGGRLVDVRTTDPAERRLLNVVEEVAIAARVPSPDVYLLAGERGLNAFAAGRDAEHAVLGITAGALDTFDRDELQAVIGHEFSHIVNGDMALNTRLIAWIAGLNTVTEIARRLAVDHKTGKPDLGVLLLWTFVVGLYMVGSLGTFLGRVLQAAISRRREELADASAVQFTRNPEALQSVFVKIAAAIEGADVDAKGAIGAAHLMFASGDVGWISHFQLPWLNTHPPLLERVQALDPKVTPERFEYLRLEARRELRRIEEARRERMLEHSERVVAERRDAATVGPVAAGGAGVAAVPDIVQTVAAAAAAAAAPVPLIAQPADPLFNRLPRDQQLPANQFAALIETLPERLDAVFVNALLADAPAARRAQLAKLAPVLGAQCLQSMQRIEAAWQALPAMARLAVLEPLWPDVARLGEAPRTRLRRVAQAFARLAAPADRLRFALTRMLLHRLRESADAPAGAAQLQSCVVEIGTLYSLFAHDAGMDPPSAFRAGVQAVLPPQNRPVLQTPPPDAAAIDAAFVALGALHPNARRALCAGLTRIIAEDGLLNAAEMDWLRMTSALLDTQMPRLPAELKTAIDQAPATMRPTAASTASN